MKHAIDSEQTPSAPRRWRFRFGLKALFVVVTVLCVWLGYKSARERRAAEMIARHNALLDAIVKNIATPPSNTFYRLNPGSEDELNRRFGRTWANNDFQRTAILRTGSNASVEIQNLTLDISGMGREDVGRQLLSHYSQKLEKLKLKRKISDEVGAHATYIWTSQDNEFTIIVDAHMAADMLTAEVRILLIDSQQLKLW